MRRICWLKCSIIVYFPVAETEYRCQDLIEAAKRGDIICVIKLLGEGADPNIRDERGRTPLHYAVKYGPGVVRTLLRNGADPDVADDSGTTPLHIAAMLRRHDVVQLLLDYSKSSGRRLNVNVQDESGKTPLHLAATYCHPNVMWLLLVNGAKPNIRDNSGETPLHKAAHYMTCVDGVKMLLEAGADPNARRYDTNRTPLHYAAMHGNTRMVTLLLKYGVDPNVQDYKGLTPLHYAVMRRRPDAVKLLLQHGADPTIRDNEGKTPIDHAREAGYTDILRILMERTATSKTQTRRSRKAVLA